MKLIECLKVRYRARKYRKKDDRGGIEFICRVVKKGHTAFDIGAHKAGYLYHLREQVGQGGKVFAFEPQWSLYQYISKLKALFQWDNVKVEHLALSDTKGTASLHIPANTHSKGSSPGASIFKHNLHNETGFTETVGTDTLDAYCARENAKPDFLKIDVEGNELKVLQGGLEILKKYRPGIIVEIEARHVGQEQVLETFAFLTNLGYTGHFIKGINRIPLSEFSFELHQNLADKANYCNNFTFEYAE